MPFKNISDRKRCFREYSVTHKRERMDYHLRRTFNISADQYDEMLVKQDGRCKICLSVPSKYKYRMAVDHDHATGKVRGLLCSPCNARLGVLESAEFVAKATKYLEDYR